MSGERSPTAAASSTWPTSAPTRPKRIVIIGGGLGGMEAARVATLRGHSVTLLEQRLRLGGSLTLASTVHGDNGRLLTFLLGQMTALKVDVRLGVTADIAAIRALNPDAVIVATSAKLSLPAPPASTCRRMGLTR